MAATMPLRKRVAPCPNGVVTPWLLQSCNNSMRYAAIPGTGAADGLEKGPAYAGDHEPILGARDATDNEMHQQSSKKSKILPHME